MPGHPDRCSILSNLASALHDRYRLTRNPSDLAAAVGHLREAVQVTPRTHPSYGIYQSNLGLTLTPDTTTPPAAAEDSTVQAAQACLAAAEASATAPSVRLRAAWHRAVLLADSDPGRAADSASLAVELMPLVVPRALGRGDQEALLARLTGIAGDAAALALAVRQGTPAEHSQRAITLLESSRAVLFSQSLDTWQAPGTLRDRAPALADRFTELRILLDQPQAQIPARSGPADLHRDLRRGLDTETTSPYANRAFSWMSGPRHRRWPDAAGHRAIFPLHAP